MSSVQTMQQDSYTRTFKLRAFEDAHVRSITIRLEWNCNLPSFSYCWQSVSSTISYLFSSNHSKPAPGASCCTVLLYFSRYYTVRFNIFSLFLCLFLYITCLLLYITMLFLYIILYIIIIICSIYNILKSIIHLLKCSTICQLC